MKYSVRITEGHYFGDITIEADTPEAACEIAMQKAWDGDVNLFDSFDYAGRSSLYIDMISTDEEDEDVEYDEFDVPMSYRPRSDQRIHQLEATIKSIIKAWDNTSRELAGVELAPFIDHARTLIHIEE